MLLCHPSVGGPSLILTTSTTCCPFWEVLRRDSGRMTRHSRGPQSCQAPYESPTIRPELGARTSNASAFPVNLTPNSPTSDWRVHNPDTSLNLSGNPCGVQLGKSAVQPPSGGFSCGGPMELLGVAMPEISPVIQDLAARTTAPIARTQCLFSCTMNRGMRSTIEHDFIQVRRRQFCSLASKTFLRFSR